MIGLIINIIRFIISRILKVYQPAWLLRFDSWCELKLGIDLIKQELKFAEKYPNVIKRIEDLEQETLTLAGHIEKLEK
tara:strand:- start:1251 stop:1484 length:234 start_codon:yes stop_codon:yes gene_type:complete